VFSYPPKVVLSYVLELKTRDYFTSASIYLRPIGHKALTCATAPFLENTREGNITHVSLKNDIQVFENLVLELNIRWF